MGELTSQNPFFPTFLKSPYPNGGIITSGGKPSIVRTPTQSSNGFSVPLPSSKVIHIRLEILDHATLVRGSQVCPRMGELECSHGSVMSLKDRFKVERQAIPERELSAGGASQNTTGFRRPLYRNMRVNAPFLICS